MRKTKGRKKSKGLNGRSPLEPKPVAKEPAIDRDALVTELKAVAEALLTAAQLLTVAADRVQGRHQPKRTRTIVRDGLGNAHVLEHQERATIIPRPQKLTAVQQRAVDEVGMSDVSKASARASWDKMTGQLDRWRQGELDEDEIYTSEVS